MWIRVLSHSLPHNPRGLTLPPDTLHQRDWLSSVDLGQTQEPHVDCRQMQFIICVLELESWVLTVLWLPCVSVSKSEKSS